MGLTQQQETVQNIERIFPSHQVWVVNKVVGGPTWCARRWDCEDGRKTINRGSSGDLIEALLEAEVEDVR